jgi:alpha-L-rhamnosidase
MLGHAEEWLYASLAGIRVTYDSAGDEWLEIKPQPVRGVEWVKAHYDSPKGRVEIHWNMTASGDLSLEVTLPIDLMARIALPAPSRDNIFEGGRPSDGTQSVTSTGWMWI